MNEVRFQQCWVGQYTDSRNKITFSIYGLTHEGKVYRFDGFCSAWLPLNMEVALCIEEHKECSRQKGHSRKKTVDPVMSITKLGKTKELKFAEA